MLSLRYARPVRVVLAGIAACLFIAIMLGALGTTAAQDATHTPTTTPVPMLDLPDWVRDPATQVLVLFAYEERDYLARPTLINAATDERFVIDWAYVDGAGWVQAENGVYLRLGRNQSSGADDSEGFTEFVFLPTGELTRLPLRDDRAPQPVQSGDQPLANGAGRTVSWAAESEIVPDVRADDYVVQSRLNLTLTEGETTLKEWSADGGRHMDRFSVRWLGSGDYLGVWTGRRVSDGITGMLAIYAADGALLWRRDYIHNVRWFDGATARALYTETPPQYFGDNMCWYAADGPDDCLPSPRQFTDFVGLIQNYGWSADGQAIIFSFENVEMDNDILHLPGGGLCIYQIAAGDWQCPLERVFDEGDFGSSYAVEPGDAYGVYVYSHGAQDETLLRSDTRYERGLCLINRTTLAIDCISDETVPPETYYNRHFWSPDRRYLAFTYTGQGGIGMDGLCVFDTQTADVTCPVQFDQMETVFRESFIEYVSWSPDSRYIAILYTGSGPGSDDKSFSRYGIVDVERGEFRDLEYAMYDHRLSELWRPPLAQE